MPTYLMLSTLTPQGVQTLKANPSRLREVNRDVEELGAKVLHQWATLGEYDFVNIVEAPDAATVAKISLALGARGSAKLQSLELVEIDTLLGVSSTADCARSPASRPSGSPARAKRTGAGSAAGPAAGRRRCTPSARRRSARRRGRARRGAGSGRGPGRARTGRRRRPRSRSRRSGRRSRRGACTLPKRDGFEFRQRGGHVERLDVGDRVDREVPGQPVAVRLEHRPRLVVQPGVLEPRLRERARRRGRRARPIGVASTQSPS